MTEVEQNWFRRVLLGEEVPPLYRSRPSAEGHDGGFDLHDDVTFDVALGNWEREVAGARSRCADRGLDRTSPFAGGAVTLRWISTHVIAEHARHAGHAGHADLIRERIDGRTGV